MRYFNLPLTTKVDPRLSAIQEALIVLAAVAAEDPDHARKVNGVGFSRPDSSKGHALAQLSVPAVLQDEAMMSDVLKMAARYRRQASRVM